VTAKFIGSANSINTARACFNALRMIEPPDRINRLRSGEKVNSTGQFVSDVKHKAAEDAIEQFTAEEKAAAASDSSSGPSNQTGKAGTADGEKE
jgi:hypothetical protein